MRARVDALEGTQNGSQAAAATIRRTAQWLIERAGNRRVLPGRQPAVLGEHAPVRLHLPRRERHGGDHLAALGEASAGADEGRAINICIFLVGHENDFSGVVTLAQVIAVQQAMQTMRDLYGQVNLGVRTLFGAGSTWTMSATT